MRTFLPVSMLVLTAVLFVMGAGASVPPPVFIIDGTVVSVESGDTITIVNRKHVLHRVRMAGIDSPEPSQPFAAESQRYLSGMISGKAVKVIGRRFDENGLLRGKVLLEGRDINLEQVVAGFAWHRIEVRAEQSVRDQELYEAAESHARKLKFNLWSAQNPTPPWLFRESHSASK